MEWQPIETAPMDGTTILAYGEYSCLYAMNYTPSGPFKIMSVVEFEDGKWRMTTPEGSNPLVDVYETEWGGKQHAFMRATHWMPLPEPPE